MQVRLALVHFIFALLALLAGRSAFAAAIGATPGNDGPGGTLAGVVNTYFPGTTATASGTNAITLGTSRGSTAPIAIGDLLLIIQMQDAQINTANSADYGDSAGGNTGAGMTSVGQSGLYEYIVAMSAVPVGGGSLTFLASGTGGALLNSYNNSNATGTQGQRRYQVIRVPQYSTATLGSTLTASPWDGNTGGVLALDVAATLTLNNATVNLSGLGFRGGGARQLNGVASGYADTDYRAIAPGAGNTGTHGSKGEGVAGTPRYVINSAGTIIDNTTEGYPNGSFARGAPGNAGGGGSDGNVGGNDQNSGGGGGGNGAAGGKGGNAWSSNEPYGGFGGALFPATFARMSLGGGGGAGTRNNSSDEDSSGGGGGGMIFIQCNAVSGSATLNVSGRAGYDAENDGAGGGGAGGSVLFYSHTNSLGNLTINARGGNGGDSWPDEDPNGSPGNRHGPGGGGGGGVIFTSSAINNNSSTAAGTTGLTTSDDSSFGATSGTTSTNTSTVLTGGSIPGATGGYGAQPQLTTVKTTSTPFVTKVTGQASLATYTITVTNTATRGNATNVSINDNLPNAASSFQLAAAATISFTGGASATSTTNPTVGANDLTWGTFRIPGGGTVTITFNVTVGSGVALGTYQNGVTTTYRNPVRTDATGTTTSTYNSGSSTGEDITLTGPFPILLRQTVDRDGDGKIDAIRITAAAGVSFSDTFGGITATVAGYTVAGYDTGNSLADAPNDNIFYILLNENNALPADTGDTNATPSVNISANTTLYDLTRPTLLMATSTGTAQDNAPPVLLAADWIDGSGGGVSATDSIILRMSEPVNVVNAVIADLGLPVLGDTLSTSFIGNQANTTTIMVNLFGTPLFTPGGVYNSGALAVGSASGIMIANGIHIADPAANTALNQTVATAVDIRPGITLLRITWDDLTTTAKTWVLPPSDFGEAHRAKDTIAPLVVRNAGYGRVALTISCSNASVPSNWVLASAAGTRAYEMKCDASSTQTGVYSLDLGTGSKSLGTGLYSGAEVPFDLRFVYPTDINDNELGVIQNITVQITATQN